MYSHVWEEVGDAIAPHLYVLCEQHLEAAAGDGVADGGDGQVARGQELVYEQREQRAGLRRVDRVQAHQRLLHQGRLGESLLFILIFLFIA